MPFLPVTGSTSSWWLVLVVRNVSLLPWAARRRSCCCYDVRSTLQHVVCFAVFARRFAFVWIFIFLQWKTYSGISLLPVLYSLSVFPHAKEAFTFLTTNNLTKLECACPHVDPWNLFFTCKVDTQDYEIEKKIHTFSGERLWTSLNEIFVFAVSMAQHHSVRVINVPEYLRERGRQREK